MSLKSWVMKSHYKRLGDYIAEKVEFNDGNKYTLLQGVSNQKYFQKAKTNTIDVDLSKYRVAHYNQFVFNRATTRNGEKISIALRKGESCIVSPSYRIFEVKDENVLHPDYLIMWFSRPEFDRYARFKSHGSAHEFFDMDEMRDVELPIPSIEQQKEIIAEYEAVEQRIQLNKKLCVKLEETAQTIYRHWFVDFEFPSPSFGGTEGRPYKSFGGEMVECEELAKEIPKGWRVGKLEEVAKIIMGQSPEGESYNQDGNGEIFYQGRTEFGFRFPSIKIFTTDPKRRAKKGEILMSVRAPVGDLNIATHDCCIGRGIASLNCKTGKNSFLFYLLLRVRNQFDVSNDEGTIFGSITKEDLHGIRVLIPNDSVRINFNNYIEIVDNKIKTTSLQTQKLEELKSLLLGKMAVEK